MSKQYAKAEIRGKVFEAREIAGGKGASIRISFNPGRKNKDGTWVDLVYLNVIVWHKDLISYALKLNKDDEIFIEGGRIEENKYTGSDGNQRISWQIAMPPFDCDIDRQLGTFGDKAVPPSAKHPALASFDIDAPF